MPGRAALRAEWGLRVVVVAACLVQCAGETREGVGETERFFLWYCLTSEPGVRVCYRLLVVCCGTPDNHARGWV